MQDQFTKCKRCNSSLCYEQTMSEDLKTWLCLSCGFTTSTVLTVGSEAIRTLSSQSPDLYKELLFEDEDQRVWTPSTVTVPEVGMIFIDGTSSADWKWKFVPAILLTEQERSKFPEGQTHRMDMRGGRTFEQDEFGQALAELNIG